ncbi:hypothetical protein D3C76_1321670 [compost metagenome]
MFSYICLIETFKTCVGKCSSSVVVLSINGAVDIPEAVVQLLRVPEVKGDHSCRYGIATTKNNGSDCINFLLGMGLKVINK